MTIGNMRDVTLSSMLALTSLGGVLGCSAGPKPDHGGARVMPKSTIEQVLAAHTDEWMDIPGVVGTGIGEVEGQPCIKVYLADETPGLAEKIPSSLDGHRVVLEVIGEVRALDRP